MNSKVLFALAAFSFLYISCQSAPQKEESLQQLISEGRIDEAKARFDTKYNINETDATASYSCKNQ